VSVKTTDQLRIVFLFTVIVIFFVESFIFEVDVDEENLLVIVSLFLLDTALYLLTEYGDEDE
jgi:hypothetical protein